MLEFSFLNFRGDHNPFKCQYWSAFEKIRDTIVRLRWEIGAVEDVYHETQMWQLPGMNQAPTNNDLTRLIWRSISEGEIYKQVAAVALGGGLKETRWRRRYVY